MSFRRALARGFTLIEMSIVLVVVGFIVAGSLAAFTPVLESSKRTDTKARMDRIEAALTLYAIQQSCLPCPASGAIASGGANAGRAQDTGGVVATACTATACIAPGVVPWQTIGLTEADILDGWNNRISYAVSVAVAGDCTSAGRTTALQNTSGIERSGTTYPLGTIKVNLTGGGQVTNCADATAANRNGAAYVLISHGRDGGGAFGMSGVAKPESYGSANQLENTDGDDIFVQDTPIMIENNTYFDDLVVWRSAPFLVQFCGDGACGNPG